MQDQRQKMLINSVDANEMIFCSRSGVGAITDTEFGCGVLRELYSERPHPLPIDAKYTGVFHVFT